MPGALVPALPSDHATPPQEQMPMPRNPAPIAPPPRLLQLLEPIRAPWEFAATLAAWPLLQTALRGDGHPVLVLPGLIATDFSTLLLRFYLDGLGHDVHGWQLGRNLGPRQGVVDSMHRRVEELHARQGRTVSLVGWSLGGTYARLLAAGRPDLVRCVITLGSPLNSGSESTRADRLYRWVSGEPKVDVRTAQAVRQAPPVPATSIYSRSDGVVAWRSSAQEDEGPVAENVEVFGSHFGLGGHPAVLYAVADRLAQPEGAWRPFDRRSWRSLVYPDAARP
jgi:pimeloyl-ACP methyl ester carboxylesterase